MATRRRASAWSSEAFLLHRYDWSETSLVLDLFTREQGRLSVAAKGAKRPYSQLRAVLLPFHALQVVIGVPARDEVAEVQTLRQAEWLGGGAVLKGSALFAGFYLNELLMRLLPRQDPHPTVFDAYAATLPLLTADDVLAQMALRAFELWLLREMGWLPELSCQGATQAPLHEPQRYALRPDLGLVAPSEGEPALTAAHWLALEQGLAHADLRALQLACTEQPLVLRKLLRQQLHYHLGGAVLRTREVTLDVQRWLSGRVPERA